MNPSAPGNSAIRSFASSPSRSFIYAMPNRQPACDNFCAIAQAMLRLFANPKITAVLCPSLIQFLSWNVALTPRDSCKFHSALLCVLCVSAFRFLSFVPRSNPVKCLLNLFHGVAKHNGPSMRATHWAICFRQRPEQPLHHRLIERHVYLDGRMTSGRSRDFRLQRVNRNRHVFSLDAVEDFRQKFLRVRCGHASRYSLNRDTAWSHRLDFKAVRA